MAWVSALCMNKHGLYDSVYVLMMTKHNSNLSIPTLALLLLLTSGTKSGLHFQTLGSNQRGHCQ